MSFSLPRAVAKAGLALLILNEVRGAIMAAPILYGILDKGGDPMALWIGLCSLAGLALSVLIPVCMARSLAPVPVRRGQAPALTRERP